MSDFFSNQKKKKSKLKQLQGTFAYTIDKNWF